MTIDDFLEHVRGNDAPPAATGAELRALWFAAKGRWAEAHRVAQDLDSVNGSWIHAHLHRDEGDLDNAQYWYARAGKPQPANPVAEERESLIRYFLREVAS